MQFTNVKDLTLVPSSDAEALAGYVLLSGVLAKGVGVHDVALANHVCVVLQADRQDVLEADAAAPDLQEPPVTTTAPVPSELPEQTITPAGPLGLASDQDGPGASPRASITVGLANYDDDICQDHEPEEIVHVRIVI